MVSDIFFIILLILINAFFVAAEFAITKVRLPQIQAMTDKSYVARLTEKIIGNEKNYLKTTQLGITLASLGLGWYAHSVIASHLNNLFSESGWAMSATSINTVALVTAFVLVVVLHFIFAELIPRAVAFRHPINTTMALGIPLRFFLSAFPPF